MRRYREIPHERAVSIDSIYRIQKNALHWLKFIKKSNLFPNRKTVNTPAKECWWCFFVALPCLISNVSFGTFVKLAKLHQPIDSFKSNDLLVNTRRAHAHARALNCKHTSNSRFSRLVCSCSLAGRAKRFIDKSAITVR